MNTWRYIIILFALVLIGYCIRYVQQYNQPSPTATPTPTIRLHSIKIRGSIAYWDQEKGFQSFRDNPNTFDELALFWYFVGEDAEIKQYADVQQLIPFITTVRQNNATVSIVITNLPEEKGTTWDSSRVENAIRDSDHRSQFIQRIEELMETLNINGVSIDFERLDSSIKNEYSSFIKELAVALHARGKFVGVALHPKTGSANDKRYEFQDWQFLSAWADELYIMAYDEHETESDSGPVASMQWVEKIVNYTKNLHVDVQKFYLGIPLYGYDWNKDDFSSADGLTNEQIESIRTRYEKTPLWDEQAHAPYFSYERNGQTHEIWFENIRSISDKMRVANDAGFGGVTFWRLGGEDPAMWEQIKTIVK